MVNAVKVKRGQGRAQEVGQPMGERRLWLITVVCGCHGEKSVVSQRTIGVVSKATCRRPLPREAKQLRLSPSVMMSSWAESDTVVVTGDVREARSSLLRRTHTS